MRFFTLLILLFSSSLLAQMTVAVSLQPQAWLVQQLGGDRVSVVVMVPPGASAHTYEPKPAQMAQLSKAVLYVACGVEFERIWLDRFRSANKNLTVVQSDAALKKLPMPAHHHGEEPGHAHETGGFIDRLRGWFGHDHRHDDDRADTHVWLSVQGMLLQARAVTQALAQTDAPNAAFYWSNYRALSDKLAALDGEIALKLAPFKGRGFMIFHPAWGYFARDYGLVQLSIELEGKEPKPAELGRLIKTASEHGVKAVFVQPRQASKSAEVIAGAIGAQAVELDPLAADWMAMMREAADKLAKAMGEHTTGR